MGLIRTTDPASTGRELMSANPMSSRATPSRGSVLSALGASAAAAAMIPVGFSTPASGQAPTVAGQLSTKKLP